MNNDDIVYFWLNDWDYPEADPYLGWMIDEDKPVFLNEDWVKENKLCVIVVPFIMDMYFFVTAKREWVEENCPSILDEYDAYLGTPNEDGEVQTPFYDNYLTYSEDNIGIVIRKGYNI